ncbi:balbiani ring protein 1-like [Orycteropus afer afer]|uniref:Balbiani ring protein 1-like n=1 Tax=Orycteropus afer afer TaxID=1230840 RepID=A0A8B7B7N1_ORYAF|nr:balbiani ring protein 1-like [Orycteropus afer afer]
MSRRPPRRSGSSRRRWREAATTRRRKPSRSRPAGGFTPAGSSKPRPAGASRVFRPPRPPQPTGGRKILAARNMLRAAGAAGRQAGWPERFARLSSARLLSPESQGCGSSRARARLPPPAAPQPRPASPLPRPGHLRRSRPAATSSPQPSGPRRASPRRAEGQARDPALPRPSRPSSSSQQRVRGSTGAQLGAVKALRLRGLTAIVHA